MYSICRFDLRQLSVISRYNCSPTPEPKHNSSSDGMQRASIGLWIVLPGELAIQGAPRPSHLYRVVELRLKCMQWDNNTFQALTSVWVHTQSGHLTLEA